MPEVPDRRSTRLDAFLLAMALALAVAWAWASFPMLFHIYCGEWAYQTLDLVPDFRALRVTLHLASAALMPVTLMVAVLPLRGPREVWRSSFRAPGVAACVAASAVLLAEVAKYPIRLATLHGELTRLQGDARNYGFGYPMMRPYNLTYRALAGSVAFDVGPHAGLAVLGVLLAFRAARISPAGPSWIDRLGRLLGTSWVLVAIGFLACQPR